MKKIEAVIRPAKLGGIKETLSRFGIKGMTVSDVLGCGLQKGYTRVQRGSAYCINLLPKVKLEVVVTDECAGEVVRIIADMARTGEVGDGRVFVYDVYEAYRIRTGESGSQAL